MSLDEYKKMDDAQLREEEAALRKKIFDLRNQSVSEKVKDSSLFRKARKDIARIQTLLRSHELTAKK